MCGLDLGRHRGILSWQVGVAACALIVTVLPANAQQQYYEFPPGSSRPSVIVDLSVLDKLGPRPTLPDMLRSGRPSVTPALKGGLLPPPAEPPRSQISLPRGFASRSTLPKPSQQAAPGAAPPRPTVARPQPSRAAPAGPVPKAPIRSKTLPKTRISPPVPNLPVASNQARVIPKAPPVPKRVPVPPRPTVPKAAKPVIPPAPKTAIAAPVIRKAPPPRPAAVPPPPVTPRVPPPPSRSTVKAKPSVPSAPKTAQKVPRAQVASVPPPTKTENDGTIRIGFDPSSSDLPSTASGALDKLIAQMGSDTNLRVQLHGYANGASDSPSQARRLSLFRALSVRTYLMKKGIRSTRIDVRALGKKSDGEDANRVDVIIQKS